MLFSLIRGFQLSLELRQWVVTTFGVGEVGGEHEQLGAGLLDHPTDWFTREGRELQVPLDVLTRRQLTKCAMWMVVIVIAPPSFDQPLGVRDRFEAVHVQTFIMKWAVETLDTGVLHGLSWPNEVQRDTALIGPFIERLRREFRAMVDRDGLGKATTGNIRSP